MSVLLVMSIFFITGTSGSGKTTLIQHLKAQLPEASFAIYDFDEKGVPPNADQQWRQTTTDYWLTIATQNDQQKKSTIICGVTVPAEVLGSGKKPNIPIYFGFIKVDDDIIKKRLKERGWSEQLIEDNINWAHFLEKEVIKQKNHLLVESTNASTPRQIADNFITWLLMKSNHFTLLG